MVLCINDLCLRSRDTPTFPTLRYGWLSSTAASLSAIWALKPGEKTILKIICLSFIPTYSVDHPASHVIFPTEAEAYVRDLRVFEISDIGSAKSAFLRIISNCLIQLVGGHGNGRELSNWICKLYLTSRNKLMNLLKISLSHKRR